MKITLEEKDWLYIVNGQESDTLSEYFLEHIDKYDVTFDRDEKVVHIEIKPIIY